MFFLDFFMENPFLSPISQVGKSYFCYIFTRFGPIKKINTDFNSPFDCEYGELTCRVFDYSVVVFSLIIVQKSIPRKWHS